MNNTNQIRGSTSTTGTPIGLVGIGLMGTAIAERLMNAGEVVLGWDLSAERRSAFGLLGGQCATGVNQILSLCDRVLLSLPSHETVEKVLSAADGDLRPGQIIIDTSTGDPQAAEFQGTRLSARGIEYLDATVSGSSQQLREGTAVFLVGGAEVAFRDCQDLFGRLTSKAYHTGQVGSGARMKLVTNLVLGLNRAALAEGLWFAKTLGLDLPQTLFLLRESMSYSRIMDTKGEKMLNEDFSPQAKLSQHLKDVDLMLDSARRSDVQLPLTETHRGLLERGMQMGLGELDNSAIWRVIAD